MEARHLPELKDKVEKLVKELVSTKKENARLNRLLLAAEAKVKELSSGNGNGSNGGAPLVELNKQLEKYKKERKIIKAKVEKMASKLDRFYGE